MLEDSIRAFFGATRWNLDWLAICGALLLPLLLAVVGDRLIRRR